MAQEIYEKIKAARQLPSPTGVALRVLEIAQNEDSTVMQIAEAVEADPAISSRLLKIVNAPLAGMPRQIGSVHRAVALLGSRVVTNLALGFSLVANHKTGRCATFDYEHFWSDSLGRAVAARNIANTIGGVSADEAFTCGLLSQVGSLALATAFPDQYADMLQTTVIDEPEELAQVELAVFGIDHGQLTGHLMRDWHLPEVFCQAVGLLTAPQDVVRKGPPRAVECARLFSLATAVSHLLTQPHVFRDRLSTLTIQANRLGIVPSTQHDLFDMIAKEWRDAGEILSVRTRLVPPLAEIYSRARERREALQETRVDPSSGTFGGTSARI